MSVEFDNTARQIKWVLIVEDDEVIAKSLGEGLRKSGFRCVYANSVTEATVKLGNQHFDCVLLDMRLPRGTGEQVVSFIRDNNPINQKTPILVMSAFLDQDVVKRLRDHVNGMLVKPFNLATLTKKLDEVITVLKENVSNVF